MLRQVVLLALLFIPTAAVAMEKEEFIRNIPGTNFYKVLRIINYDTEVVNEWIVVNPALITKIKLSNGGSAKFGYDKVIELYFDKEYTVRLGYTWTSKAFVQFGGQEKIDEIKFMSPEDAAILLTGTQK